MLGLPSVREGLATGWFYWYNSYFRHSNNNMKETYPRKGIILLLRSDRYIGIKCVIYGYSCAYALYYVSIGDVIKTTILFVVGSLI